MTRVGNPRTWALGVFAAGLLVAGLAGFSLAQSNRMAAERHLEQLSAKWVASLTGRVKLYKLGLLGARGLVISHADALSREAFLAYSQSRDYDKEFPGARGIGVIRRVAPGDEVNFVSRARRDGWPSFKIQEFAPHEGDRLVIQYIEPVARNEAAVGLDIGSERNRREAALAAMRSGEATLSGLITLVQAVGKPKRSFLLLLPIYRPGMPLGNEAEREKAAEGWAYSPLVIDEVLENLDPRSDEMVVNLSDLQAMDATPFYTSLGVAAKGASSPTHTVDFPLFGKQWRATLQPTQRFYGELHQPSPLGLSGVLAVLSAVIGWLTFVFTRVRATERDAQLAILHRAAMRENASDAIIVQSLEGVVIDWNTGAERMFGYLASDAVGKPLMSLLLPLDRQKEEVQILTNARLGRSTPPFETTRMCRDGSLVHVSVVVTVVNDAQGDTVGIIKVIRDISEAKRSQKVLSENNDRLEQLVEVRTQSLNKTLHDFHTILDVLPSIFGYWDSNLINCMANKAYGELLGLNAADMIGKSMEALMGPAAVQHLMPHIQAVLGGDLQTFEQTFPGCGDSACLHALTFFLPDKVGDQVQGFYVLTHDLTELNESRQKLAFEQRNSAALLHTIHQHAIVSVADRAGLIIEVNDNFCEISGFSREEVLGENHRLINSGHHSPEFWESMWATISSGQSWFGDICNRSRDGTLYWVDSIISPVLGTDGLIEKYISIRTDITERKRLEANVDIVRQRQEESERFLRNLTDQLPVRMAYVDRQGRYQFVNQAYCDDLGYAREAILGRTRDEIHGLPYSNESMAFYDAVLKGSPQRLEFEELVRGQWVCIDAHLLPDVGPDGSVQGVYKLGVDITERRQAEAGLRQTMTLLNTVIDAANQFAIIATRTDGLITLFNKGAENLLGFSAEEVVGVARSQIFLDGGEMHKRATEMSAALGREVIGREVLIDETVLGKARDWVYRQKNGTPVPVSLVITPMLGDEGELVGYLGIAHDVSLQKELERSLRNAVHQERSANRAKSQFLANMSHEIRTPMNAVIGLSYLLERTTLDPEQGGLLSKITVASKSLLSLINNILDLSKIEASELKIEQFPFSLAQLLGEVRDLAAVRADARGVALKIDVQHPVPEVLEGDSARLHQILLNLLTNAVKFTEAGQVTLRVSQSGEEGGNVSMRFEVADSGIGMTPEEMSRLFMPFAQADASTTRRFGGTGLGLSIVKQLVQLMGGSVGVDSTLGVGSRFWVVLPMRVCEAQALAMVEPVVGDNHGSRLDGVRVLVADDSEINLEVAKRILELEGALVSLANHGQEAVAQLLAAPDSFDVVLLDLQMPVLDGFDTSRRIRGGLGLVNLPLIALSASTLSSDMEQAKAAGIDAFVSKPFDPAQLVAAIRRCLNHADAGERQPPLPVIQADKPGEDWPAIEGVDVAQARVRLGGDQALFFAMLKNLVAEFGSLGQQNPRPSLADLGVLAARLHKLKGSAGTLGAEGVAKAAGQCEKACRAEAVAQVHIALKEVGLQMRAIQGALGPVLAAQEALEEQRLLPDNNSDAEKVLSAKDLTGLIATLQSNDLAALEQITALSPALRQAMGARSFADWKARVDMLDFAFAAEQLADLRVF